MNAIAHFFGLDNGSGALYLFWSGVAGDAALVAWMPVVWAIARRHNCHTPGCWRIGRFPFSDADNTQWHFCKTHHPADAPGDLTEGP